MVLCFTALVHNFFFRPMNIWRILLQLFSRCGQRHGGVKCSIFLSVFIRHWTISLSNFSEIKFHENASAFLELLAVRRTDRNGGSKRHEFAISRREHVSTITSIDL
jgi:hypothetical protein